MKLAILKVFNIPKIPNNKQFPDVIKKGSIQNQHPFESTDCDKGKDGNPLTPRALYLPKTTYGLLPEICCLEDMWAIPSPPCSVMIGSCILNGAVFNSSLLPQKSGWACILKVAYNSLCFLSGLMLILYYFK